MNLPELPALMRFNLNRGVIREHEHGTLCWHGQHAERESILVAEIERLRAHASALAEVMAMIHGDGGHYLAKHGPTKAAEDAAKKHAKLCAEVEAMRAELRSALFNVDTSGDIGPHSWAYVELANVARDLVDASRGAP